MPPKNAFDKFVWDEEAPAPTPLKEKKTENQKKIERAAAVAKELKEMNLSKAQPESAPEPAQQGSTRVQTYNQSVDSTPKLAPKVTPAPRSAGFGVNGTRDLSRHDYTIGITGDPEPEHAQDIEPAHRASPEPVVAQVTALPTEGTRVGRTPQRAPDADGQQHKSASPVRTTRKQVRQKSVDPAARAADSPAPSRPAPSRPVAVPAARVVEGLVPPKPVFGQAWMDRQQQLDNEPKGQKHLAAAAVPQKAPASHEPAQPDTPPVETHGFGQRASAAEKEQHARRPAGALGPMTTPGDDMEALQAKATIYIERKAQKKAAAAAAAAPPAHEPPPAPVAANSLRWTDNAERQRRDAEMAAKQEADEAAAGSSHAMNTLKVKFKARQAKTKRAAAAAAAPAHTLVPHKLPHTPPEEADTLVPHPDPHTRRAAAAEAGVPFGSNLTEAQVRSLFQQIHPAPDGDISPAELVRALKKFPQLASLLGLPAIIRQIDGSKDRFQHVFNAFDVDDNKKITLPEFIAVLSTPAGTTATPVTADAARIQAAKTLLALDAPPSAVALRGSLTKEQALSAFAGIEHNEDGTITADQFMNALAKDPLMASQLGIEFKGRHDDDALRLFASICEEIHANRQQLSRLQWNAFWCETASRIAAKAKKDPVATPTAPDYIQPDGTIARHADGRPFFTTVPPPDPAMDRRFAYFAKEKEDRLREEAKAANRKDAAAAAAADVHPQQIPLPGSQTTATLAAATITTAKKMLHPPPPLRPPPRQPPQPPAAQTSPSPYSRPPQPASHLSAHKKLKPTMATPHIKGARGGGMGDPANAKLITAAGASIEEYVEPEEDHDKKPEEPSVQDQMFQLAMTRNQIQRIAKIKNTAEDEETPLEPKFDNTNKHFYFIYASCNIAVFLLCLFGLGAWLGMDNFGKTSILRKNLLDRNCLSNPANCESLVPKTHQCMHAFARDYQHEGMTVSTPFLPISTTTKDAVIRTMQAKDTTETASNEYDVLDLCELPGDMPMSAYGNKSDTKKHIISCLQTDWFCPRTAPSTEACVDWFKRVGKVADDENYVNTMPQQDRNKGNPDDKAWSSAMRASDYPCRKYDSTYKEHPVHGRDVCKMMHTPRMALTHLQNNEYNLFSAQNEMCLAVCLNVVICVFSFTYVVHLLRDWRRGDAEEARHDQSQSPTANEIRRTRWNMVARVFVVVAAVLVTTATLSRLTTLNATNDLLKEKLMPTGSIMIAVISGGLAVVLAACSPLYRGVYVPTDTAKPDEEDRKPNAGIYTNISTARYERFICSRNDLCMVYCNFLTFPILVLLVYVRYNWYSIDTHVQRAFFSAVAVGVLDITEVSVMGCMYLVTEFDEMSKRKSLHSASRTSSGKLGQISFHHANLVNLAAQLLFFLSKMAVFIPTINQIKQNLQWVNVRPAAKQYKGQEDGTQPLVSVMISFFVLNHVVALMENIYYNVGWFPATFEGCVDTRWGKFNFRLVMFALMNISVLSVINFTGQ